MAIAAAVVGLVGCADEPTRVVVLSDGGFSGLPSERVVAGDRLIWRTPRMIGDECSLERCEQTIPSADADLIDAYARAVLAARPRAAYDPGFVQDLPAYDVSVVVDGETVETRFYTINLYPASGVEAVPWEVRHLMLVLPAADYRGGGLTCHDLGPTDCYAIEREPVD